MKSKMSGNLTLSRNFEIKLNLRFWNFLLGVSKALSEGVDKIFEKKVSYGYPQPKVGKSQEISGMGCRKRKGQKTVCGCGFQSPPVLIGLIRHSTDSVTALTYSPSSMLMPGWKSPSSISWADSRLYGNNNEV